jgi:hypothetical protein
MEYGYTKLAHGNVQLTVTEDDYAILLTLLGFALRNIEDSAAALSLERSLEMVNRINAGNPRFRPICRWQDLSTRELVRK